MELFVQKERQVAPEGAPKKVRLRLLVLIPLSFCFFTLASGYLTFNLSTCFFVNPIRSNPLEEEGYFWILLAVFLITGLSTLAGLMIAYAITTPLRRLSSRVEALIPKGVIKTGATKPLPSNELDLLSQTLEEVFNSLERMIEGKSLESLSEGVIVLDREGKILQINKVAEKALGINPSTVIGKAFKAFFTDSVKYGVFQNRIESALVEGCTHIFEDMELPTLCSNGAGLTKRGSLRFKGRIIPERDTSGDICGVMVAFQYPSEMEQIRWWLKHADQMAGLGTMAAGIAHEIRNPLASIRGLMELVREDMTPNDPHRSYAEQVIKEVDRMDELVGEVLEFAQTENTEPVPQNVNVILKEALRSIQHRFSNKRVEVVEVLDINLPQVLSRPEKLRRAFENIILNAFEATPEGGRITITSTKRNGHIPGNGVADYKVVLRFHNTGSFIPPEELERIFLPFYTTKTKGTGLGLPIARRVISSHGGQISVDSDKEKGTAFVVELPTC